MNWLSKKIIISVLKNYFEIEDEKNIEVSILGRHQIKCSNLMLKKKNFNNPQSMLHVQQCTICNLDVVYDSSVQNQSSLIVKINGVKLQLKFNEERVKNRMPRQFNNQLNQFKKVIQNEGQYKERNFFQEEIYQLKKIIGEFCIGKFHTVLTNIDVSLQYTSNSTPKYLGGIIGEIVVKQRVVIINNGRQEHKEQLHCSLCDIGVYLGIIIEENIVQQSAYNREVLRKNKRMLKKFLISKQLINAFYHLNTQKVSIIVQDLSINISKLCIRELHQMITYALPLLNHRPKLRPGQGPLIKYKNFKISKGTEMWWSYIREKIITKIKTKDSHNILTDKIFKSYLFCLFYRYTFGKQQEVEKYINQYQYFKSTLFVMINHHYILQKIHTIQNSSIQNKEIKGLIQFLRNSSKNNSSFNKIKLQTLTYNAVYDSIIFTNFKSCCKYFQSFKEKMKKMNILFVFSVNKIQIFLRDSSEEQQQISSIYSGKYRGSKIQMLEKYFSQMMNMDGFKGYKAHLSILLGKCELQSSQRGLDMKIYCIKINDNETHTQILNISHTNINNHQIQKLDDKLIKLINSQNQISLFVTSIFINFSISIIRKLLLLINYMDLINRDSTQEQQFIKNFISKKIPSNYLLKRYQKQSIKCRIPSIIIVTSVFDKDRVFSLQIKNILFTAPCNDSQQLSVEKTTIMRTSIQEINRKYKNYYHNKQLPQEQSYLILENNRLFSYKVEIDRHKQLSQVVIPFILVQISIQDLYYCFKIMNKWIELFSNYIVLKRQLSFIDSLTKSNQHNLSFAFKMQNIITNVRQSHVKIEGCQLILYGQNIRFNENQILSVLVDNINLINRQHYVKEVIQFTVDSFYVKNCIGYDNLIIDGLLDVMLGKDLSTPLISRSNKSECNNNSLIVYHYPSASNTQEQTPFMKVKSNTNILIQSQQCVQEVNINIPVLYLSYDPIFLTKILKILQNAQQLACKDINSKFQQILKHEPQILINQNFSKQCQIIGRIESINIMAVDKNQPVILINLDLFQFNFKNQLYIYKLNFTVNKTEITDISQNAGPHCTIYQSSSLMKGNYTKYNSKILKQKYIKSAKLILDINDIKIYYLNKKIKELINLVNMFQEDLKIINKMMEKPGEKILPFCYNVNIETIYIQLIRNTLSSEFIKSNLSKISIYNYKNYNDFEQKQYDSIINTSQIQFKSCQIINQNDISFKSFQDNNNIQKYDDIIYIQLHNFQARQKIYSIINCEIITIQYQGNQLSIYVPNICINLVQDYYRLLIRFTQENLAEVPNLFVKQPKITTENNIDMKSFYTFKQIVLKCLSPSKNTVQIILQQLKGINTMYSNGQKLDEITIFNLNVYQNQNIEIIGKKKQNENQIYQKYQLNHDKIKNIHKFKNIQTQYNTLKNKFMKQQKINQQQIVYKSKIIQNQHNKSYIQKEITNSQKLCKWISGVCKKCFNKTQKKQKHIFQQFKQNSAHKQQSSQVLNSQKNKPQISVNPELLNNYMQEIQNQEQIRDFKKKINPNQFDYCTEENSSIYINIATESSKEKKMYILMKNCFFLIQKNQSLLHLISFFNHPYAIVDIEDTFRKSKFNNYPANQMIIDLKNCCAELIHSDNFKHQQKIQININLRYNSQRKGDIIHGPGKSTLNIDLIFQILFFITQNKSIKLSQPLKIIYEKIEKTNHKKKLQPNRTWEYLIGQPYQPIFTCIRFYIPAFIIKSLKRIIEQSLKEQKINKEQKQENNNNNNKNNKYKNNNNKYVNKNKQKQKNELQTIKQSILYINEIKIDIKSNIKDSFLQIILNKIQYSSIQLKKQIQQQLIQIIKYKLISKISINYLNLKISQFQPFIQPWKFLLTNKIFKKNLIQQSSKIKIQSYKQQQKEINKYQKSLNINLSTALFHTYKELELKYQQNQDNTHQICFNLIHINSNYQQLFSKQLSNLHQSQNYIEAPQDLKNFFGRKFVIKQQPRLKKNKKNNNNNNNNKDIFHPQGYKIYLYHSYFDHIRRKKRITYRTPYRIINLTQQILQIKFIIPKNQQKWQYSLKKTQYYCIPNLLYNYDILINFSFNNQKLSFYQNKFCSLMYLLQFYNDHSNFSDLKKNVIYSQLFSLSSNKIRQININNKLISCNKHLLTLTCIKIEQQYNLIDKLKMYQSILIIISPIIIKNKIQIPIQIKIIHSNKYYKLQPCQKIQINQFQTKQQLQQIKIIFQNTISSIQYQLFKYPIGITIQMIQIQLQKQLVNLKIIRQTLFTCYIQIYADWILFNRTNQKFQLKYGNKLFILNQQSISLLSIQNAYQNSNQLTLFIYDQSNNQSSSKKFIINGSTPINIFTMYKELNNQHLIDQKKKYNPNKCCLCCSNSVEKIAQSKSFSDVYQCIEFVLNIQENQLHKSISIQYRYILENCTSKTISIYQCHKQLLIFTLQPKQKHYLYHLDFLQNKFFLQTNFEKNLVSSQQFSVVLGLGKSFTISFKKPNYIQKDYNHYENFYYLQIDISQYNYTNILKLNQVTFEKFPIYIHNVTQYNINIIENSNNFNIKPYFRIPFSWSNLTQKQHQIQVTVEGVSQIYCFNQKSQFQPIIILEDQNKYKKKTTDIKQLFMKEICTVKYQYLHGSYLVILDLFQNKLFIQANHQNIELDMKQVLRINTSAQQIEILFKKQQNLQLIPDSNSFVKWVEMLESSSNQHIMDRIFFTIQSCNNSVIFLIQNIGIETINNHKIQTKQTKQIIIDNIYISVINDVPQEVVLLHASDITYLQKDSICKMNYKQFNIHKSQHCFSLKKLKINNQLESTANPVILSQIKKNNFPFLELRAQKQNLIQNYNQSNNQQHGIQHYKKNVFFLDQAEFMIQAALQPQLQAIRNKISQIINQYAFKKQDQLYQYDEKDKKHNEQKPIYINCMEIKPIKMTVSISLNASLNESLEVNFIGFLRWLPLGVDNAIIQIESYTFYHIFCDQKQIRESFKEYYQGEIKKQILYNTGSYEIFAPIQLVQGLGFGVKSIFYDPIYQFVNTKQIKAATTICIEGIISLIILLLTFFIKFIDIIVKLCTLLTFDPQFRIKRDIVRKQIFKSPFDGAIYGGKYFFKITKKFFLNFCTLPCQFYNDYYLPGFLVGFVLCFLNFIPWTVKMMISCYDLIYIIGLGFINWGNYEQDAMKYRSRPIRTFPHQQLVNYDFLKAQGNEIMRKHMIKDNDNEQIVFVNNVEMDQQTKYLILSNYRILYSGNKLSIFNQIQLFRINSVKRKKQNNSTFSIEFKLSIPNKNKILFFQYNTDTYKIFFKSIEIANTFMHELQKITNQQNLNINFEYQKNLIEYATVNDQHNFYHKLGTKNNDQY